MITEEAARKQLEALHQEGSALAEEFAAEQRERLKLYGRPEPREPRDPRDPKKPRQVVVVIRRFGEGEELPAEKQAPEPVPEPIPPEKTRFGERYQSWYSRTLPLMKELAPDRHAEFQSFYVEDPRFSWRPLRPHVIQDFLRSPSCDPAGEQTVCCFQNQLAILKSVWDRLAWSALDTEDHQVRGQQLSLLEDARGLIKVDERAAGVVAGSVLSAYLKKLAGKHRVKLKKASPPAEEWVKALKEAKVFDAQVWSQASWLAEIESRSRSKGEPPTKLQVRDLIDGTRWLLTNVF